MTDTSDAAIFARLRALQADCGDNKHDQATALISASILEGWDTGPRIVGALRAVGMDPRHVAIILSKGTGPDPERHHWHRGAEGRHSLHEEEPVG